MWDQLSVNVAPRSNMGSLPVEPFYYRVTWLDIVRNVSLVVSDVLITSCVGHSYVPVSRGIVASAITVMSLGFAKPHLYLRPNRER